jgi:osmotically-inducible protein OsmY
MLTTTKTASDLKQDVLDEFDFDPLVEPNEVGVQVDEGVVTLTGTVQTLTKKWAAERAAFRVEGVRAVANDLSVHSKSSRNDTDIAKDAADALARNTLVPVGQIDVTVNNGKITLAGEVRWDFQRQAAAKSLRYLAGVRDVINLIQIKPLPASAYDVKQGIERALVRAAELDADRIHVFTENGSVRLTGTVRSWAERQAAADAAWRAPSVTSVTNEIDIRSY